MNQVHFFAVGNNRFGGPYYSIPSLLRALNRLDNVHAAMVITNNKAADFSTDGFSVFTRKQFLDAKGGIGLPSPFDRPDLVVLHSTYIPAHAAITRQLVRLGIPYVLCPRGGMTCKAQRSKWLKKKIANFAFFNRMVARAAAVHYLTPEEAAASRRWNRPSVVVGNGISPPPATELATPGQSPCRRLVFVGRLAMDHKGLDLLVEACGLVRADLIESGAQVQLFGPDWRGARRCLGDRIAKMGLQEHVVLPGPVCGDAKAEVYRGADAFVLTSRWEGHPISILEALSYGLPCLVTPGTNMADAVACSGAGWRVELSASHIAVAIQRLLRADQETLRVAGANARELALREYSWDIVGAKTAAAYERYAIQRSGKVMPPVVSHAPHVPRLRQGHFSSGVEESSMMRDQVAAMGTVGEE
ncbi:MAG: glycosyltransferase [Pirellulales bacterium]|nr:glycosyltransferase [Pirellulales bacterium]